EEVLAERQFRIAEFYYLRENLAAAQARLGSLIESFPLYSGIDEALYEMGELYEKEAGSMKMQSRITPAMREKMVAEFEKHAIDAYSRIITRYPAMGRAEDARRRLAALKAPIPTPTAEALAESKAEEESRGSSGMTGKIMDNFRKHPDVAKAAKVGEPSMEQEKVDSAPALVQSLREELGGAAPSSDQKLGIETVGAGTGTPQPNQAPPSSSTQPGEGVPPPAAPAQVNEIQKTAASQPNGTTAQSAAKDSQVNNKADSKQESSSKKKKKKGLRKLIPF
ncbi:MAG: hypothetical protein ACRD4F_02805, partial [Candidatus Angelobacter sp.]